MALTLDLDFTTEAKNGDIFLGTITDATVYGGANPARADGALYITGEKMNADGTVEDDITFVTYSPSGVDAWTSVTFDIEKDGWHKFKIVFIRDFNIATNYAQYEAVYSGGVVYRATQASVGQAPPNASYWEVVSEPTSLLDNDGTATESPNLEFQLLQRVIYPNAKVLFGNKAEDAAIEGYGDSTRGEDVLTYEFVRLCVEAMNSLDQRGKQADGERVARRVEEFANS
jgi:hypothetical protein